MRLATIHISIINEKRTDHHLCLNRNIILAKNIETAIFGHQNEKNSYGACNKLDIRIE